MEKQYDIIIIGGGMAGVLAAVAAAQEGGKTLLIEKEECLGGIGTSAMVSELLGVSRDKKMIYGGVIGKIFAQLVENGDAMYNYQVPMSSNPNIKVDRLRCNPEIVKLILESTCMESGVEILYDAICTKATDCGNAIEIETHTLYEKYIFLGTIVVDATGNANIAHMMNYHTTKAEPEMLQVSTRMIRLSCLDLVQLEKCILSGEIQEIITKGFADGVLKGRIMAFAPIPNTHDATFNVTRSHIDHEDAVDVTKGICEANTQIPEILAFIRANVPGCQNAALAGIASTMGIRDARRIEGEYVLTGADLLSCKTFDDVAALGTYPLDIHDPITNTVQWTEVPGVYEIPMRCMIPIGSTRLIVTGRAVSADAQAFSAIRVMPTVMNLGETAGCMAAALLETRKDLTQLDVQTVHTIMAKRQMNFT